MSLIKPYNSTNSDILGYDIKNMRKAPSKLTGYSASSEEYTGLNIVTADGDKVTLSSEHLIETDKPLYDRSMRANGRGGSHDNTPRKIKEFDELLISIGGDLSQEESEDIKRAMEALEISMEHLANGDMQKAIESVMEIEGLDTLSHFDGTLHYERNLTIESQLPGDGISINEEFDGLLTENGIEGLLNVLKNLMDGVLDGMINIMDKAGKDPGVLKEPIQKMFERIKKRIGGEDHLSGESYELLNYFQQRFSEKLDI